MVVMGKKILTKFFTRFEGESSLCAGFTVTGLSGQNS